MARDEFSPSVINTLRSRVSFTCSNPECNARTGAPHTDDKKFANVGEASHICAASENGPRYDPSMSAAERSSIHNAIWLCKICARKIDVDEKRYSVAVLKAWKAEAEASALENLGVATPKEITEKPDVIGEKISNLPLSSIGGLFKGRSKFLEDLRERLTKNYGRRPVAICGLGGVGKTRAALEYAWISEDEYAALLFVSAETPEILKDRLAGLCETIDPRAASRLAEDPKGQYDFTLKWLQSHSDWLLIADNVDTPESARALVQLLPRLAKGHVCITTRRLNWSAAVIPLDLSVLSEKDGGEYLLEATSGRRMECPSDESEACDLSSRLGGLILAIEHAAAYIGKRHCGFKQYQQELDSHSERMLAWHDEDLVLYHKSVAETWLVTFEALDCFEKRLLRALAWLDHAPIPRWLIGPLRIGDTDLDSSELLAGLASWHLVTMDAMKPFVSMHRLVQEVTRLQISDPATKIETLNYVLFWLDHSGIGDPSNFKSWPAWMDFIAHALFLADRAADLGLWNASVKLFHQSGIFLRLRGNKESSWSAISRGMIVAESNLENGSQARNSIELDFANSIAANGEFEKAEKIYRKLLSIEETNGGPNHPMVAVILNDLGGLMLNKGDPEGSLTMLERALAIERKRLPPWSRKFGRRLANLAAVKRELGDHSGAQDYYLKALPIFESSPEPTDPDLAKLLTAMADNLREYGNKTDALALLERALRIYTLHQIQHKYEHPEFYKNWKLVGQLRKELGLSSGMKMEFSEEEVGKDFEGRFSEVIEHLEKERKSNPQFNGEKIQRNQKCPCGSGKKHKHCCGNR